MKEEKGTETKLCKHCKTEIPKKAKVCPNCRKKQSGIGKWILIIVVIFILFGAASGGEQKPKKVEPEKVESTEKSEKAKKKKDKADQEEATEETKAQTEETEEKSSFGIGETAELNDIQVTMLDYYESQGSEYNKPTEGYEFVMAEFEIVNNSDKELHVSSVMSFEGYADDYALNYSFSAALAKDGANQLDGTVAPGKKMNGVIGYEVPTDWKNIEIHFTDNVWSSSKFKFEINR